jgi:catechol 2,3-dioxygenase-like lactoylglutathione lyase family enzyme
MDVEKSLRFYAQVFGASDVMRNNQGTRRYLKLGSEYLAFRHSDTPRIDHFAVGINQFDIAVLRTVLMERGISYRDDSPGEQALSVGDADGTQMQLIAPGGWAALKTDTASPEIQPLQGQPIFRPLSLRYVLVNVANRAMAEQHYSKILERLQEAVFSVGAGRLRLQQTPEGGQAGVDRVTIFVGDFNPAAAAAERLIALGARMKKPERQGSLMFLDPDGFQIEVIYPQ